MVGASARRFTLVIGGVGVLSACGGSTDGRQHQERAQQTLIAQAADNGVALNNARCGLPANSSVGSTLECTAEDRDGFEFEYVITIREGGTYEVTPLG